MKHKNGNPQDSGMSDKQTAYKYRKPLPAIKAKEKNKSQDEILGKTSINGHPQDTGTSGEPLPSTKTQTQNLDHKKKSRTTSRFNYSTAGGEFLPTQTQRNVACSMFLSGIKLTTEQKEAAQIVISGHESNKKVHHDYIHIVNEFLRTHPVQQKIIRMAFSFLYNQLNIINKI